MATAIERQVILPWRQVVHIAFNSLRVRLLRSLITTLTLVLAVAFAAYLWAGYEMLDSVWPTAAPSLQERIVGSGYEPVNGHFGASAKDRWLVILSLLVCVVGIINAQLMAVTERFREIGTFKCLGALDSFVVKIFVLEAMYQGLLGGLAGGLLGVLTATAGMIVNFGWVMLGRWPPLAMLAVVSASTGLAVLLSFIGVLYPAVVAARMQPAVALRNEN